MCGGTFARSHPVSIGGQISLLNWLLPQIRLNGPFSFSKCRGGKQPMTVEAHEEVLSVYQGAAKGGLRKGGVCKRKRERKRAQTQTSADFRLPEKGPKTQVNAHNANKRRQTRTNAKSKNYTPFYAPLLVIRQPKFNNCHCESGCDI